MAGGAWKDLGHYPYHYAQFDLTLAWELNRAGFETQLCGVLKNSRYALIEEVEVWVAVLDGSGGAVARRSCFVRPSRLGRDESAPFSLTLPLAVAPGLLLRFSYRYRGSDGGDGDTCWSQSFDWVVPEL